MTWIARLLTIFLLLGLCAIFTPNFSDNGARAAAGSSAKAQLSAFKTALQLYKLENGTYPTNEEGLEALLFNPRGKNYLEQDVLPKDPWGNAYIYKGPGANGNDYLILCFGADRRPGGDGDNADLLVTNGPTPLQEIFPSPRADYNVSSIVCISAVISILVFDIFAYISHRRSKRLSTIVLRRLAE